MKSPEGFVPVDDEFLAELLEAVERLTPEMARTVRDAMKNAE